ncbi:hypothetical protein KCU81_g1076, partial [Aureobasidium melanogenum]|uniref:Uncharacterized protein n=1 Tax=Aureobasidium melanogenum (strain CBS 110374) TaxID=1043003 RepID=A0A074W0W1_AURM1
MCNTVSIHYSCNHFAQFHRSTCRSTIWVTKRTTKTKNRSKTRVDNSKSDDDKPSRGRTLERTSDKTSTSSSPSSNDSASPSPPPKLVSKAACKSTSNIVLRTQQRCGPCQRTFKRGFLQIRRARQDLPSHKKRKHLKRGRPISGGSPLKHELTLDELLRTGDEVMTGSGSPGMLRRISTASHDCFILNQHASGDVGDALMVLVVAT